MNMHQQYLTHLEQIKQKLSNPGYTIPNGSYHYLYQITNNINGKIYVGRRTSPVPDHLDYYLGSGLLLWKAYDKYGIHNFTKTVTHVCTTFEELCALEQTIVNHTFINRPETYNVREGGFTLGRFSDQAKINSSISAYNRPKVTLETRLKMSNTRRGKVNSESTIKHMSDVAYLTQNRPDVKLKKSVALTKATNRPWKNGRVKNNINLLEPYLLLDLIYDLFISLNKDFSVFEKTLPSNFKIYLNTGLYTYLNLNLNPREDLDWISLIHSIKKEFNTLII